MAYDDTATVSGSVVSFSDGADEVGLKSCVVSLPASLSGYSSVDATKVSSKNILTLPEVDFTINDIKFYTVNGILYLDGTQTAAISSLNESFKALDFWLPKGTYYFNRGTIALPTYIRTYDDMAEFQVNNGTFTISEPKHLYVSIYMANKTFSNAKADMCVSVGSTAITYEDSKPKESYVASLGRTIYGGTADIVMGEGTETHKGYTLDNFTWSGGLIGGNWVWYVDLSADGLKLPANSEIFSGICDNYTPIRYNGVSGTTNTIALRSNGYLYVNNGSSETEPTGKVTIELATSTDFTFTPISIETSKGSNTFWSEQGDSEVTYYKDGYGTTSVTIHKETPDGEPVVETAKFHRIVYGGTADVIKGTCEPKNLFVKDNPNEVDGYFTTTGFSTGNANAKTVYIPIVGGETYTVSKTAGQIFQIATAEVIPSNGASFTGRQANNTATSLTITASANDKYLWAWVFLDGTDTGTLADMLDSVQIEKGSSATEYVPGFTPFSFPPISMSTDEGENTLFADEGDSAIVYRKETD